MHTIEKPELICVTWNHQMLEAARSWCGRRRVKCVSENVNWCAKAKSYLVVVSTECE